MILKTYSYRIYPNKTQEELLIKFFGSVRFVYNWGLEQKIKSYKETGKSLSWIDLDRLSTNLREANPWLTEAPSQSLTAAFRNLDRAYINFFNHTGKFPKFKTLRSRQSFQYPQHVEVDFNLKKIYLPKIGWIKYRDPRVFEGKIKTTTIVKTTTNKYFAQILVELPDEVPAKKPITKDTTLGIDVGLTTFATLSDGTKLDNPKFLKKSLKKLRRVNRKLSRTKKGSKNREKARIRLAKGYEDIKNQRNDFLHKLSTKIVNESQINSIAVETLNIAGMLQNSKLARSISDASWSEFIRQLEYKCNWKGKNFVKIGRFFPSSKLCDCGEKNKLLELSDRMWTCTDCGRIHDRDILAANNIKDEGFRILSTGSKPGINVSGDMIVLDQPTKEKICSLGSCV